MIAWVDVSDEYLPTSLVFNRDFAYAFTDEIKVDVFKIRQIFVKTLTISLLDNVLVG